MLVGALSPHVTVFDERNRSTAQRREAQDERSFTFVASFSRSGGQCAQKKGYRRTNL